MDANSRRTYFWGAYLTLATTLIATLFACAQISQNESNSHTHTLLICGVLFQCALIFFVVVAHRYSDLFDSTQAPLSGVLVDAKGEKITSYVTSKYRELRSSIEYGSNLTTAYNKNIERLLDWTDNFFGDVRSSIAISSPTTRRKSSLRFQLDYPIWTAAAYDRCLLLAMIYPALVILAGWLLSNDPGTAGLAMGLQDKFGTYRFIVVALIVAQDILIRIPVHALISRKLWPVDDLSAFSRLKMAWKLWSLQAIRPVKKKKSVKNFLYFFYSHEVAFGLLLFLLFAATMVIGGIPAAVIDITSIILVVGHLSKVKVSGLWYLTLIIIGTCVFIGSSRHSNVSISIFPVAYASGGIRDSGGPGAAAILFTVAFSLLIMKMREWAMESNRVGIFYVLLSILYLEICFLYAIYLPTNSNWQLVGSFILFCPLFALLNALFDWFSLGVTRLLLRTGLEWQGIWPLVLSFIDACVAILLLFFLVAVLVVFTQIFDFIAMANGAIAPILPINSLLKGLDIHHWQWHYFWLYGLLITSLIPSIINCIIASFSFVRMNRKMRNWLLTHIPVQGPIPDGPHMMIVATLALQWTFGILGGIGLAVLIFYVGVWQLLLPACDAELVTWAQWVAGLDVPGWIAGWF